jgi:UDP-N-acetylmuramoyl-L-alanyl-D-glutamate--2,6-diaminopimelate ligase
MRLDGLIAGELVGDAASVEISALAYDSRRVTAGALFFCVPGFNSDGHEFAPQAVRAGAAALVVERPLQLGVPEVVVASARAAMAPAAARFYGEPARELRVVGVTGTNGKTTTAYLVRALLEASGEQCGMLGTVTSVIGAPPPRRSTCRPTCGRCSTAAIAPARWRSPRTRSSSDAWGRLDSRRRCSPT